MTLLLTEEDVQGLLKMEEAIEACEEGFRHLWEGLAVNQPRSRVHTSHGIFQTMTASDSALGIHGFKVYSTGGSRSGMLVFLYSSHNENLLAIAQANTLGQIRTGAATGLATKYMARPDATTLGVVGTGYQAKAQIEAVCAVRSIAKIQVYSRNPQRRYAFSKKMTKDLGIEVVSVNSVQTCVEHSDVIVIITNSSHPVLERACLKEGMHINAVGSNQGTRQEVEESAVGRCAPIVVDDLDQANGECGDLLYAEAAGVVSWAQIHSLAEVVAGAFSGRPDPQAITLFESQGIAMEDIVVAKTVYEKARQQGMGSQINIMR